MVSVIKKYKLILTIIVIIIFAVIIILINLKADNKGRDSYIDIFHKNQSVFTDISSDLMQLEYEIKIEKESNKIVINKSGDTTDISQSLFSEKTKNNITNVISEFGIKSIEKTKSNIEFIFKSNKDVYSIVYAKDKKELINYTSVEDLEDNWYYCYIMHE